MYNSMLSLLFLGQYFNCSTGGGDTEFLNGCVSALSQMPNINTLRQLGSFSALKSEWETEGTHISKQAWILDTILASLSLMSQLAGIHILAKQKDNYASAWWKMCWWKKHFCSWYLGQALTSCFCYTKYVGMFFFFFKVHSITRILK